MSIEEARLKQSYERSDNWHRWGPYLSERQWGTVREDYSENGDCWTYFPHDHARSRAYRWGEDGLLGICDRQCRLCFGLALWNGKDPILKERLFGLTGPEGNHGEDVKESYFYLDSTPTHSYMKALYKYPQNEYPYKQLVKENKRRGRHEPEYELVDTGVFDDNRYFDVTAEYAKANPEDILIRITIANRAAEAASIHLLPTLWFRNTWVWGCTHEGCERKPTIFQQSANSLLADHPTLGRFRFSVEPNVLSSLPQKAGLPEKSATRKGKTKSTTTAQLLSKEQCDVPFLFTENETNAKRVFGIEEDISQPSKDAFHDYVIHGDASAVSGRQRGTKSAAHFVFEIPAHGEVTIRMRLTAEDTAVLANFGKPFDKIFSDRIHEANEFYSDKVPSHATSQEKLVVRQAFAGLLWSKQFYHYSVEHWMDGDSEQPKPPESRKSGRNNDWKHLFNRDIISMPDKWEYPWYAAWDLAFHMIPMASVDIDFAKSQLLLMLREWYMHPSGQIPAYEFAFGDVNPPVHAWACWRVYKMSGERGNRDTAFLARAFQKLIINFTWWVNRKDVSGKHLFSGGFLGLDNIGVFDRSKPLPTGGQLEQADGTAWMAFYSATMLSMALELAHDDPTYEDVASKFFEHFVAITDAMNCLGGTGLWDEEDGFYYDQLHVDGRAQRMKIRSIVGIIPLFAVEVIEDDLLERLPGFRKRMDWFLKHRSDLARQISYLEVDNQKGGTHSHRLLAIPSRERLERVLKYVLDEKEFLAPHGIRALSQVHRDRPFELKCGGEVHRVEYDPGDSTSGLFGGNSNWRGPIWFPVNYLLIEAIERYHHFYGDTFQIECPTGSGVLMNLQQVAQELSRRLGSLFLPDGTGQRPCHGQDSKFATDPHWQDLLLFHEYFHGETGRGVGASHQTGWTALVTRLIAKSSHVKPKAAISPRAKSTKRPKGPDAELIASNPH